MEKKTITAEHYFIVEGNSRKEFLKKCHEAMQKGLRPKFGYTMAWNPQKQFMIYSQQWFNTTKITI